MTTQKRARLAFTRASAVAAVCMASAVGAAAAELPRSHITLPKVISADASKGTITLPLYHGTANGSDVYYIVTEASKTNVAREFGANLAPNIAGAFVQHGTGDVKSLSLEGTVDFSSARVYTSGATGFPPAAATPGAVGDAKYSPFVKLSDGTVINAPIVATGDAKDVTTHADTSDRVLAISDDKKTVTILLAQGFFNGSHIVYLSTEASDPGVAAIERATYVKKLNTSKSGSEAPILALANGQTGAANARAQGLAFLALDGNLSEDATLDNAAKDGSPLNILATFNHGASAPGYTPLWAANVGVWSKAAVAAHRNVRLESLPAVFAQSAKGTITAPDGKTFGPSGFVVNCPVVGYVDKAPN